ncbi:MAG: hypothetical protein HZB12_02625 [Candidatus Yonathbacteria bacterium]|nr:hypothetical protein [Candidatus Yonathbacteria bacterium]
MNTSAVVLAEQEVFFKTSLVEIKKDASLFLDVGKGKLGKDKKEYLGFPPIKPIEYGGAFKMPEPPILIFKISNLKNFRPEMVGERWEVKVERIEITSQLTSNKQYQRVLVRISVVKRMEHEFRHYDRETTSYIIGVRSGRALIAQDFFKTEEEVVEYHDPREQAVRKVCNVYARIGSVRELVSQIIMGGVLESALILERASAIFKKAMQSRDHGDMRKFREKAAEEIRKYVEALPKMPKHLIS